MAKTSVSKKSLVIVESPAKAKTINRYLGPEFEVKASMGHVRDLPSKGLNVDIENDFEPTYDILPGKKRTVTSLKQPRKNVTNYIWQPTLIARAKQSPGTLHKFLKFQRKKHSVSYSTP